MRLSILSACLVSLIASASWTVTRAAELAGRVIDDKGAPIAGARAFLYGSARRSEPPGEFVPTCCLAFGRSVQSNSSGKVAIGPVDTGRVYQLLVVAVGFEPALITPFDPLTAGEMDVRLRRQTSSPATGISGRVVDALGAPVTGAIVELDQPRFGGAALPDPERETRVALTNSAGKFHLATKRPIVNTALLVQADGLARRRFANVTPGRDAIELNLAAGHAVEGRLVHQGTPIAGVIVVLAQKDRNAAGNFVREFTAISASDGRFRFEGVPANEHLEMHGAMTSCAPSGFGTPVVDVQSGAPGNSTNVGDLNLESAHSIAGRVVVGDGAPLPQGAKVFMTRAAVGDSQTTPVAEDGSFRVPGLPSDLYTVMVTAAGYSLSAKNKSYDPDRRELLGVVNTDIAGLRITLISDARPAPPRRTSVATRQRLLTTPLQGSE